MRAAVYARANKETTDEHENHAIRGILVKAAANAKINPIELEDRE